MDAVADLTAERSRIKSTNPVSRREGNVASDCMIKTLSNVQEEDLFSLGPVFCEFGTDFLTAIQKTTKENTERLHFLLDEQKKYIKKRGLSAPFVFKDDDKENRFVNFTQVAEEEKGETPRENFDCVQPRLMIEKKETVKGDSGRIEKKEKLAGSSSENLLREFGWGSDEETAIEKEKETNKSRRPARFSVDRETTSSLEIYSPPPPPHERDPWRPHLEKEDNIALYSWETEETPERSPLPCSSKDVVTFTERSEQSPKPYQSCNTAPKFYTRKKMKPTEKKSVSETSPLSSSQNPIGQPCEGSSEEGHEDDGPFFVISSVVGNADLLFAENSSSGLEAADDWHQGEREESDGSKTTITPKKTDDITKIKGWRRKQFSSGKDFPEESRDAALETNYSQFVIKQEPPDAYEITDSAFVCDSLDDFLDREADLKVNYEIPHLYAEVGIKLTSDEIVSRPAVNEIPVGTSGHNDPSEISDFGAFAFPGGKFIKKRNKNESEGRKRTDDKKMRDRCIRNLIDYRYQYVSSGGKLVKVAGSYDSRPFGGIGSDGRPGKVVFWGNKTKAFDDIFKDLMQEDEVNEERAADKSVVLLHNRKSAIAEHASSLLETTLGGDLTDTKTEPTTEPDGIKNEMTTETSSDFVVPELEIPTKETEIKMQSKLLGLTVYPSPYRPLPSVVQYHLRKLRSYRTKVDPEWANFAVSALDYNRDPRKRARMILPVFCPVVNTDKQSVKDYDAYCQQVLVPFQNGAYFKNFNVNFGDTDISSEVREVTDYILTKVEKAVESPPTQESSKKKRGKGRASKMSADQIISSDEKRTRKLPGRFKDTTILEEKVFPSALRSCDFSSSSFAKSTADGGTTTRRRWGSSNSRRGTNEKMVEWQRRYGLKECSVVMQRLKGFARVAPWCMKHDCYSCAPCRLVNPSSFKFFKFPSGKRKRPSSSRNKTSPAFTRNVALKRTGSRRNGPDVYRVPVSDENGDIFGKKVPLAFKNAATFSDTEDDKEKKRLTLENLFKEERKSRAAAAAAADSSGSVKQITFKNKVVTKLLGEKLKDLKSPKAISGSMENLKRLRQNVIELIKLNLIKSSYTRGHVNIWYLKGKTSTKSRAFLTFSKHPPVDGAINLKSGSVDFKDLPKVITEIVYDKGPFDSEDYAILHCDGSLWEIHGSLNFTVEKSLEPLERPIQETRIVHANVAVVSELGSIWRSAPDKLQDVPTKWWIMDMSQEYLEISTQVGNNVLSITRESIMLCAECGELKSFRFINIGRQGRPLFGLYILPSVWPYGLVGPYQLHESHGLELRIHEKTIPFIYRVPGSRVPRLYPDVVPTISEVISDQVNAPAFGLGKLIQETISNFDLEHKSVAGMWLHDKTVDRQASFLEIYTELKKMPQPTPRLVVARKGTKREDLILLEHDYTLASSSFRTCGSDQSRLAYAPENDGDGDDTEEEYKFDCNVYLVPDIPSLGYVRGMLMSDHSVTIRHPINRKKLVNSLKMGEWLNNFLRQKIKFSPKDLEVKWRTVTDSENVGDVKPLNKKNLANTHILCEKGLFYLLEMDEKFRQELGVNKDDVLEGISHSTTINYAIEAKELGKLLTMGKESSLTLRTVVPLAVDEIKSLKRKHDHLVKIKKAKEKQKIELCNRYTEMLKASSFDDERKRTLFETLKSQLLAIQMTRRKTRVSESTSEPDFKRPKLEREKEEETSPEQAKETAKPSESTGQKQPTPEKRTGGTVGPKKVHLPGPKSSRKKVSLFDKSKIRKTVLEAQQQQQQPQPQPQPQPQQISSTEQGQGCEIKIVDAQLMTALSPPKHQIEQDVPKAAVEETVTSVPEVPLLKDSEVTKMEAKVANLYRLLRTKTRPEDAAEYKRLLSRLTTVSRQLDKIKGVVGEKACTSAPSCQQNPAFQQPSMQKMGPCVISNSMQPVFLIVDSPAVDPAATTGLISDSTFPGATIGKVQPDDDEDDNSKQMSQLERAVFNGNQKFKIERKLTKTRNRHPEPHYVVHKPYFPPETRPSAAVEQLSFEERDSHSPTIANVMSLQRLADDSADFAEYSDVAGNSNFSIYDTGNKIRILKNPKSTQEVVVRERLKMTTKEFIPLTCLNSTRNLTVRRRDSMEKFPTKSKGNFSILKSVLARQQQQPHVDSAPSGDALMDTCDSIQEMDSSESWSRTDDGEESDAFTGGTIVFHPPAESQEEKRKKSVTSGSTSVTVKRRGSSSNSSSSSGKWMEKAGDSDEETSWLTIKTEDIEKNFYKLIEPIVGTEGTSEKQEHDASV